MFPSVVLSVTVMLLAWTIPASRADNSGLAAESVLLFERAVGNSDLQIRLINGDGTADRLLTRGFAPRWSPDGKRIAFQRFVRGSVTALYVVNRDGTGLKRLVANIGGQGGRWPQLDVAWSPDGSRLAFIIYRVPPGGSGIGVVGADGRGLKRLTRGDDETPTWSPDGRRITFARFTGDTYQLVSVSSNGGAERVLPIGVDNTQFPTCSPDGLRIAFQAGGVLPRSWDIYVANADGTGATNLTRSDAPDDQYPQWSPDSRGIVFESANPNRSSDVHTIGVNGSGHRKLTRERRFDGWPSWSPDGRRIAFASARDGNVDLYVMTATGRNPANLTNNEQGTYNSLPAWPRGG